MKETAEFPPEGAKAGCNCPSDAGSGRGTFSGPAHPGERLEVEADIFADGHDTLSACVKCRREDSEVWREFEMVPTGNDRWRGEVVVGQPGFYFYTIEAWVDRFKSWQEGLRKKIQAKQEDRLDLAEGVRLIYEAARRADALDAEWLEIRAGELKNEQIAGISLATPALDPVLTQVVTRHSERLFTSRYERDLPLAVDSERARYSAWYEMFPRSTAADASRHGSFKDCLGQLDRIADMGFDILYFPPIHPIGQSLRKGKNNNPVCQPGEPGSPWAIGAASGGHKAIHPQLGSLEDFRQLVTGARAKGIEIALDIALQCSPDHPYVKEHPEWFRKRADGSIQYAENPPKKYQDIYPFDFECQDWRGLWTELRSIFEHWITQGVRVFRVDNPHTKSFAFWEWCLGSLQRQRADLVFLAEAFTRPAVLYHLAKLGFNQSYNYFPWRNSKEELTGYLQDLTHSSVAEFFRPNLWTNTPDILPVYLQTGGRPAFKIRLILAATLAASYGVYGPAFESFENTPVESGSEEYLGSEKYEIRHWELDSNRGLHDLMKRLNRIRRENPALQFNHSLEFHAVSNDMLLAYTKSSGDGADTVLTVVNLDPHHAQTGWLDLPVGEFLRNTSSFYQMHDLLTDARFLWRGARNFIELNPQYSPAHIFRLRQRLRTERDFDYYM